MYLSKLLLDPRCSDARRDLESPYDMHRTLKRAFPDGEPDDNRLLFRVEPPSTSQGRIVLVQSSTAKPSWAHLRSRNDNYAFQIQGPQKIHLDLRRDQVLSFRMLGNPTKKNQGKRIALTDEDDYWEWLERKARRNGFEVLRSSSKDFWINGDKDPGSNGYKKRNIPHFAVRFEGLLQVQKVEKLQEAVASGIGPAKSFGFGLLSLAPPR